MEDIEQLNSNSIKRSYQEMKNNYTRMNDGFDAVVQLYFDDKEYSSFIVVTW